MAFRRCPDCGAEWWAEETCLDCGAALVDIPDESDASADDEPVRPDGVPLPPPLVVDGDPEPPRLARFLGFFVDYLVISMVAVALGALTSDTRVRFHHGKRIEERISPTWALAAYGVFILVYATVTVARWQRTPGMVATGLAVERVDADGTGRPLTWAGSAIRALLAMGWFAIPPLIPEDAVDGAFASVLSWIFFLWPIVLFAPILIDVQRRGLHDLALRTRVVRRSAPDWARAISGLGGGRRRARGI